MVYIRFDLLPIGEDCRQVTEGGNDGLNDRTHFA